MENWKDISGYEGLYQVSDWGRVKSLNYHRSGAERLLVGVKNRYGYLVVSLYKDGKAKMYKVHRLVARAFIPNPDGLPQVNHRDEDKTNNIATNLEYCDAAYNSNYGTRNERVSKAKRNDPTKSKAVFQYTLDGSLVRSYPSTMEAGRRTGYDNGYISACCLGKYKQAYGYLWSYNLIDYAGRLF